MSKWNVYYYESRGELKTKLIHVGSMDPDKDYFVPSEWSSAVFKGIVEIDDDNGLLESCEDFDG